MLDDFELTLSQIQPTLVGTDARSDSNHQSDSSLLDIYFLICPLCLLCRNMYADSLLCPLSTAKSFNKYSIDNCFNVTCHSGTADIILLSGTMEDCVEVDCRLVKSRFSP